MRTVLALARADLRRHLRSWVGAALLLAVAGAVVLTAATGSRRTDTAYTRMLEATDAADAVIAVSGPGGRQNVGGVGDFYEAVAKVPGVEVVAPQIGVDAVAPDRGGTAILLKAAVDRRFGRAIERPRLTEGRLPDPSRRDEVVADRTLAVRLGLHAGDVVTLGVGTSATIGARVVGIGVTRDNVVPVTAFARNPSMLVTPALLRSLSVDDFAFESAYIRLAPGTTIASFRRAAQELVASRPETGGQLFVVDAHEQAAKVSDSIRPQAVVLALFSLLVGLAAVLIVGQVLVRQVQVGSSDHATLRAVGFDRTQLRRAGLATAAVPIVGGTVLAVVLAIAASPLMPIGPARVAEPHPGVAADWVVLGCGALALVVLFAARVTPSVRRVVDESMRAARHTGSDGAPRRSRAVDLVLRSGAPISASMGARLVLEPGRGRTSTPVRSTLAVTAVGVAAVAAAATFGTNLVRLVDTPRLYGQAWQVALDVEFGHIPRADVETFLRRQPQVTRWTFGDHSEAIIDGRRIPAIALSAGRGPLLVPTLLEGRAPASVDEIVLGTKTLDAAGRRVGQTVVVTGADRPRRLRIVGRAVFPFFGQGEVTPTGLGEGAALLQTTPDPDGFNFVLVGTRSDPAGTARLAHELGAPGLCREACRGTAAQPPTDVSNFSRIRATPSVFAGILALLALAAVSHLLITSIRQRRRDLGVLRSVGFLRRQVVATVAWQATIVVAVALLVGLPVGIAAGRWAWVLLAERLGLHPDPTVPLRGLLLAAPASIGLAAALAAVLGWQAGGRRPSAALRPERGR